jgi:hypothetical protein
MIIVANLFSVRTVINRSKASHSRESGNPGKTLDSGSSPE